MELLGAPAVADVPAGSADGASPAAHALGDADEQHRRDDRHDGAQDVELAEAAGAQRGGDQPADERADDPQRERGQDAEVLPTRLDQAGDGTDDQTEHEESDDAHARPVPSRSTGQTPGTQSATSRSSPASRVRRGRTSTSRTARA